MEAYISERSGLDLDPIFRQYLNHPALPTLQYSIDGGTLHYRWRADVPGFSMPLRVTVARGRYGWIVPTDAEWRRVSLDLDDPASFAVDQNFYVNVQRGRMDARHEPRQSPPPAL